MNILSRNPTQRTVYAILFTVSIGHFLNDMLQAIIPAAYPLLKEEHGLSYGQIGFITLVYQIAASVFQPLVGNYTDKHPHPYSQISGMAFTFFGVLLLGFAWSYTSILTAVFLVGIGSSIFHPESSRIAFLASGGRRSLAQSIFQIGGSMGTAIAPLLVVMIVLPYGQRNLIYFAAFALLAKGVFIYVGQWYAQMLSRKKRDKNKEVVFIPQLSEKRRWMAIGILLILIISKYFYTASIGNYFHFYTMHKFGLSENQAQVYLFYFLISVAVGTLLGGFFGDKFGRKYVIVFSVLGAAPFALALPYVNVEATAVLIVCVGLILSSAFPAILVYAQELLPKNLGMVSGFFYGFAFAMGGIGSALLGWRADHTSIEYIYFLCSFLPLFGVFAIFLPDLRKVKKNEFIK